MTYFIREYGSGIVALIASAIVIVMTFNFLRYEDMSEKVFRFSGENPVVSNTNRNQTITANQIKFRMEGEMVDYESEFNVNEYLVKMLDSVHINVTENPGGGYSYTVTTDPGASYAYIVLNDLNGVPTLVNLGDNVIPEWDSSRYDPDDSTTWFIDTKPAGHGGDIVPTTVRFKLNWEGFSSSAETTFYVQIPEVMYYVCGYMMVGGEDARNQVYYVFNQNNEKIFQGVTEMDCGFFVDRHVQLFEEGNTYRIVAKRNGKYYMYTIDPSTLADESKWEVNSDDKITVNMEAINLTQDTSGFVERLYNNNGLK